MDKIDTRKLSTEAQQHNRNQAIRLYREGIKRADNARIIDINPQRKGYGLSSTTKEAMRPLTRNFLAITSFSVYSFKSLKHKES